jgi:ubiquinone/menaquinone biosynthesis C-methylase UbiE
MTIEETRDKKFYDSTVEELSPEAIRLHCAGVKKYVAAFEHRLSGFAGGKSLRLLELGAGSCVTSLLISRGEHIGPITCLDVSLRKMQQLFSLSVQAVATCSPEKISMVEGHFDERLPFTDESFDVVIFDGALHHARSMWFVLEECRRVLSPGGALIAQREQYLGALTAGIKLRRLLQTPEVKAGVSENAYLRAQYEYYLRAVGFESVTFIPVAETALQKTLGFLNGLVFSKWVIWAQSAPGQHA